MTIPDDRRFELLGPLPSGKVAIQASAGTGKTFALAALATRFIVEADISASELLIVTFTRAATNELRAKVRDRLVAAAEHLADRWEEPTDDELLQHLSASRSPVHLERLRRAITEFDAATVTTIHGFAGQVLSALGVSAGTDLDARLDIDSSGLIEETCADILVSAALDGIPVDDLPGLDDLRQATTLADGRPDLHLVPVPGQPGATPAQQILCQLVERSVEAVAERRARNGTLSFNDVLTQLRDALCGPGPGAVGALENLRSRFKVVLIDEFQDTDPVQWDIFATLFDQPGTDTTLVLVGDPKQAIYAFRGADIHTYLRAVGGGSRIDRRSLTTNWRSDGAVLESLEALFTGATFGDAGIPFVAVDAAPANRGRRIVDSGGAPLPALSLRLAVGGGIDRQKKNIYLLKTGSAERAITADLVSRVRALLDDGCLPEPDQAGGEGRRPVRPSDIAVLVTRHLDGANIQAALLSAGIPAVVARGGSVLQTPAAEQMRCLVEGLSRPSDAKRARMVALSWFVGRRADELASLSDADLVSLQEQLRGWSELMATHSVADVFARIWTESGVLARVLGSADGDRNITDLDHLVELFHAANPTGRSGPAALLAVLGTEPDDESDAEVVGDVSARRIASEADAVQVMTIWAAKGLEFPVVCLPTLWRPPFKSEPVAYIDPETGTRTLDLARGKDWPDPAAGDERTALAFAEATGERLRLLYVALTRAQHQTMVWWANVERSSLTALARFLFARSGTVIDPELFGAHHVPIPDDDRIVAGFDPLVAAAKGTLEVVAIDAGAGVTDRWSRAAPDDDGPELEVASLGPLPDRSGRRWSFSAIVDRVAAGTVDPGDPSMSDRGAGDEQAEWDPDQETASTTEDDDADADPGAGTHGAGVSEAVSVLSDLPAGTAFGTLVHSVLEEVDFAAVDLGTDIDAAVGRQLEWRSMDLTPLGAAAPAPDEGRRLLVDGLRVAIETPLGPLCDGARLADIAAGDRLDEMSFDLRLATEGPVADVRRIGEVILAYLDPDDPLRPWAQDLAGGAIDASLAGHLTGSIDLVMRIGTRSGRPRFVVADYKTNALHRRGVPVGPDDYRRPRLAEAMAEHDYPLQAVLYSVALHRYLRWRLPEYRPDVNLGGVVYLFLRGMCGDSADGGGANGGAHGGGGRSGRSGVSGVFEWALPADLVVELSDLLDGRPTPVAP